MAQADDPADRTTLRINAMQNHTPDHADGADSGFSIVPTLVDALHHPTVKQQKRKFKRQAALRLLEIHPSWLQSNIGIRQ
jgi:hypothetical protein